MICDASKLNFEIRRGQPRKAEAKSVKKKKTYAIQDEMEDVMKKEIIKHK